MAYKTGPYNKFTDLPVQDRPEIHNARGFNVQTKAYEFDDTTGGYEDMDHAAQRIVILCSLYVPEQKFNTPNTHNETRKAIIDAVRPMVDDETIVLKKVEVSSGDRGTQSRVVWYDDLTNGQLNQTVQLP